MFQSPPNAPASDGALSTQPNAEPRSDQRIDSSRLLAGQRELVIDHAGQQYRLRLTRNDKLILTK